MLLLLCLKQKKGGCFASFLYFSCDHSINIRIQQKIQYMYVKTLGQCFLYFFLILKKTLLRFHKCYLSQMHIRWKSTTRNRNMKRPPFLRNIISYRNLLISPKHLDFYKSSLFQKVILHFFKGTIAKCNYLRSS